MIAFYLIFRLVNIQKHGIKTKKTFEYHLYMKSKGIVTTHNFQNK